MLADLLGGFIVITIGTSLIPAVADNVWLATHNSTGGVAGNITGAASTILGLTTLFFALGVMSSGVAMAIGGLRNAGMV